MIEPPDFAKPVVPLEECYCPDFGRLAIHPEVMVRALLICSLYSIVSLPLHHIYQVYARAGERNRIAEYRRERRRRQTVAEGTCVSLDRLAWDKSRLRGLWKTDCEGYVAAVAHNVLKMVRRRGCGVGPPVQLSLPTPLRRTLGTPRTMRWRIPPRRRALRW